MKLQSLGLGALGVCALLVGCSTATVVTLQDGTEYITKDYPKTRTQDGFYEFEDLSGRHVKVRPEDVATVKEED